jgi:RNA polymerase sigma factor (sigma-70 family)
MSAIQCGRFVRQLRNVLARHDLAGLNDGDLWRRYLRERSEAAFETLVRRHAPMVMGVCRRVLRNEQDAEDAFQATLLVLVRKGSRCQSPVKMANWLHGVAYRTALEARRAVAIRRAREAKVIPRTVISDDRCAELRPVLDEEIGRLTEKYRAAVVLCDLEGRTRQDVARLLGCPEGTVASRLARGRTMLAMRLARRGFPAALVVAALADGAAGAAVPAKLVQPITTVACWSGAANAVANPLLTVQVTALAEGAMKSMLLTKIKTAIAVCMVFGITTLGAGGAVSRSLAGASPEAQEQGRANPDDFRDRVRELKAQLQQLQTKVVRLEAEAPAQHDGGDLTKLFKHRVPFEIGVTESNEGGRVEILEVRGTRPRIEIGGQYLVRGKYVLPRGERGKLYLYQTAAWNQPSATLDLQVAEADKSEGEFTLIHSMLGPGYFHVVLAHPDKYSRMFANVYFGTGDNVLRKKTW